ncbi:MAG: hypothetical protein Ct9H300mP29_1040 [Candidatus Neomarinimicrobiota bacterium]|nr:MAG: hypothetical protein Ct9H300mP29_1040 [Candidatus Neomarinimicrobiota bacterium]
MFTKNVYCDVIDNTISGGRVVRFEYDGENIYNVIDRVGISPLPPYIKRESEPKDKKRYQTVFSEKRGAVAAPTAGLHFTDGLLKRIHAKGAKTSYTTLHIGLGTFRPVQVEDLKTGTKWTQSILKSLLKQHYLLMQLRKNGDGYLQLGRQQLDLLKQWLFPGFKFRRKEVGLINLFIHLIILKWLML